MTIQEGLLEFYKINHFDDDGGEKNNWAWIKFRFLSLPIPNPESRKKVLFLHDIHHLITENDTTWKGESSVGAWEVATGGWGYNFYIWWIILGSFLIGVFGYPTNTFKWFVRGCRSKSVVGLNMSKSELLVASIKDIKNKAGLVQISDKPATFKEFLIYLAWIIVALTIYLLPLVFFIFLIL
jgi:hypothetical protein